MKNGNNVKNVKEIKNTGLTEEEINSPEFDPDEFAPAPDKSKKTGDKKHSSLLFAVMCAVFAGVIALLGIFAPMENTHKIETVREKTVLSQFKYCTEAKFVKTTAGCDVYAVYYKDKLAGIGMYHTVKGFADNIEMLLVMGGSNEIVNVMIVDENESLGLGDKIKDKSFLDQFRGMTVFDDNTDIDLISRATASADAVVGGVKDILETGINTFSVAKDLKIETITADEIAADRKNNKKDESEETTGDAEETTGKASHGNSFVNPFEDEKDGRELDGRGGGANGNKNGGDMNVDGKDVTTVYETETKETETSDTTKAPAEDTTKAPKDTEKQETKAPVTEAPVTEPPVTEPPVTEPPETEPPETEPPVTEQPAEDSAEET